MVVSINTTLILITEMNEYIYAVYTTLRLRIFIYICTLMKGVYEKGELHPCHVTRN